jgi:outer membrane protein OmpA-like peptidoglycan-associated protein/opacity protein-like surface antigen
MKLKTTLFAAAATLAVAPAAHAYQGFYGAIGAGLNYLQPDQDVESVGYTPAFDSEADYRNGIGVYTALGYDWGNKYRGELEFAYRQNDTRHYAGDGLGFSGWFADGDLQSYSIMLNLIRDFDTGGALTPYVGFGAGGASFKNQVTGPDIGFGTLVIDDSTKRLVYQAIAGVAVNLADGLALDLSYRYFRAFGTPKFDGTIDGVPATIRHDYDTHSLFAGLRWNFGASAAPAATQYKDCWDGSSVPAASECPPQLTESTGANLDPVNVIVYFDYDKSNLTPEASNLIKEAAARALANDVDTVVVSGHADRSGGSAYNQALSERRGSVVRDALVANGIAADKIRMEAYGEDKPAKPTEDGVREPLNRRTEVVISFQ